MKPTLHLIYSVPESTHPLYYRWDKYAVKYRLFPPSYRGTQNISWPKPIAAPYSITYHLIKYFQKYYKIKLYDWREKGLEKMGKEDVMLFQPTPDFSKWESTSIWSLDKKAISLQMLEKYPNNQSVVILPYNHPLSNSLWLKPIFEKYTQSVVFICGEYWINTWEMSPYKEILKERPLQVNMGININDYKVVKKKLNLKGKRRFLYIGNTQAWKNTKQLEEIAKSFPDFEGGYISSGEIKGWKKISNFAHLTFKFMEELSLEYDFFLSTSIADAQATTILEQMCFGMAVACTPESGYSSPSIIKLHTNDTDYNYQQVQKMQDMTEKEYFERVRLNLQEVENSHNWDRICEKIYQYISLSKKI
jgi:hypothetical protein